MWRGGNPMTQELGNLDLQIHLVWYLCELCFVSGSILLVSYWLQIFISFQEIWEPPQCEHPPHLLSPDNEELKLRISPVKQISRAGSVDRIVNKKSLRWFKRQDKDNKEINMWEGRVVTSCDPRCWEHWTIIWLRFRSLLDGDDDAWHSSQQTIIDKR